MKGAVSRWFARLTGRDVRDQQRELMSVGKQRRDELLTALARLTEDLKGKR